jgi:hypothetical protein
MGAKVRAISIEEKGWGFHRLNYTQQLPPPVCNGTPKCRRPFTPKRCSPSSVIHFSAGKGFYG